MLANIHEQSKEIGLLRALGVTRTWIARLYALEAMVLVLSASVLGLAIGTLLAFTISAQRQLFTQLPLPFVFPTAPIFVIVVASLVSGVLAAFIPAMSLLRNNVVSLLRSL
jgi:ABC-type antimicrobial peptide transport system permease subunit